MGTDLDAIRDRLQSVADDLADAALERLRSAVEDGEPARALDERRLTRARRAVEKAIAVLGGLDAGEGSDGPGSGRAGV